MERVISVFLVAVVLMMIPFAGVGVYSTTTDAVYEESMAMEEEVLAAGGWAAFDDFDFGLQVPENWTGSVWRYIDEAEGEMAILTGSISPEDAGDVAYIDFLVYKFAPEYMDEAGVQEMLDMIWSGYTGEDFETTEETIGDYTYRMVINEEYEMAVAALVSGQNAYIFTAYSIENDTVMEQFDVVLASVKINEGE